MYIFQIKNAFQTKMSFSKLTVFRHKAQLNHATLKIRLPNWDQNKHCLS